MRAFWRCAMLLLAVAALCPRATVQAEVEDSICGEACEADTPCEDCVGTAMQTPCRAWTIDYRVRSMFDSHTCYEFGTNPGVVPAYAPLSRLDWSLDSVWTGLQIGLEKPNWGLSFEWLTPMQQNINGSDPDYDWLTPTNPSHLDSLSYSQERWTDGQMLDLKGEFKLTDRFFTLPIQVWPTVGFRFQRFDIMAHDTVNVIPTYYTIPGDVGSFNQQYYIGYVGGQLRTALEIAAIRRTIDLTFQGDWGATSAYNVDHHISDYEPTTHRYTMESTSGGAVHLALIAETAITKRFNVGLQADHMAIHTTGTHRWLMYGDKSVDETWSNGVVVKSDQTSLTAFLRARF